MSEDFPAFFARTAPHLLGRAIMLCGHRQNAEDAVQEAYLQAYRFWPRIRDYESPEGWVDTVMRQQLFGARKRWWNRWRPVELEVPAPAESRPEELTEALAVIRALALLPPRQRQVLVMHCLYGLPYQEIAARLGISTRGVGSNLAKAREKLSTLLGITPDRDRPEEPLVAAATTAGGRLTAGPIDPLVAAVRAAEAWLVRGLAADDATLARLRKRVRTAEDAPRDSS